MNLGASAPLQTYAVGIADWQASDLLRKPLRPSRTSVGVVRTRPAYLAARDPESVSTGEASSVHVRKKAKAKSQTEKSKHFRLKSGQWFWDNHASAESDWAIAGWCCCTLSGALKFVVVFSWTTVREGRKSCVPALPSVDRARLQSCVLDGRPVMGCRSGLSRPRQRARRRGQRAPENARLLR